MFLRRIVIVTLLLALAFPFAYSTLLARRAQSESETCPASALQSIDVARRWAPWSNAYARQQTRLALELADYQALAATRRWWASDQGDGDFLRRAARIESRLAGHPSAQTFTPELDQSCTDSGAECALWRASLARWQLYANADYDAALAALGWSLEQCRGIDCEPPAWPVLQQSLRMAWRYRSARELVHQWITRSQTGLPLREETPWLIRLSLDRRDLVDAVSLHEGVGSAVCFGSAAMADQALLETSIRLRQERYADAHRSIEQSAEHYLKAGDARGEVRLLPYRAYLAMRQRRWKLAAEHYAQMANSADAWIQRDAWVGQANVHMHQGNYALASDLYRQALARDDQLRSADPSFRMRALSMLGQAALQQGDLESAVAPIIQARDLARSSGDVAAEAVAGLAAADLYHQNGASRQALAAVDAALALELVGQRDGHSPFMSAQYDQALRRVYRLATDSNAAALHDAAVQTLWRLHRSMRRRPQRMLSPGVAERGGWTLGELQSQLGENRQLISYGYAADQVYALRASATQLRLTTLPSSPAQLEELASRWLAQLRREQLNPELAPDRQLSAALYAALIGPLHDAGLAPGDRLLINPVGALASLSWAGLSAETSGQWRYLIDDHAIQIVAAIDWLRPARAVTPTAAVVIVASDAPEHARAEAQWVAERLGVEVHDGAQLAESAIRSAAEQAGRLHFSGHGVSVAEHPLQSYLGLSPPAAQDDGRWRVAEVLAQPVSASVVVLGACEGSQSTLSNDWTWYADIDMASAFVHAGADWVVSSVLPAPDQPTAELMRAYYEALDDGDTVDALAQAQRLLARRLPISDWAGFRVTGGAF